MSNAVMPDMASPAGRRVEIGRAAGVLTLTLDRPDALNAIDAEMLGDIERVLGLVEGDDQLVALVLRARGRVFSAGADLKAARARANRGDGRTTEAFLARVTALLSRLESLPVPTLAIVEGLAVAGGLELVLCCDLVIATEAASFGDAHANFGLLPGGGGSVRLPRRIGAMRAKELMFTGRTISAALAADWGLVTTVVAAHALEATIEDLLQALRTKSPLGLRRMKRLVDDNLDLSRDEGLANEQAVSRRHAGSYDRREGLQAFNEKRRPVFLGR